MSSSSVAAKASEVVVEGVSVRRLDGSAQNFTVAIVTSIMARRE